MSIGGRIGPFSAGYCSRSFRPLRRASLGSRCVDESAFNGLDLLLGYVRTIRTL